MTRAFVLFSLTCGKDAQRMRMNLSPSLPWSGVQPAACCSLGLGKEKSVTAGDTRLRAAPHHSQRQASHRPTLTRSFLLCIHPKIPCRSSPFSVNQTPQKAG